MEFEEIESGFALQHVHLCIYINLSTLLNISVRFSCIEMGHGGETETLYPW
jgi:hypothetical protein